MKKNKYQIIYVIVICLFQFSCNNKKISQQEISDDSNYIIIENTLKNSIIDDIDIINIDGENISLEKKI